MFKQHARTLSVIQRIADILSTALAWSLSYFIRFVVMEGGQSGQLEEFVVTGGLIIVLLLIFNTRNNLYETNRYFPWYRETLLILKSQFQTIATFVILLYFIWPMRLSRVTIMIYVGISLITILIERGIIRGVLNRTRSQGKNLRHVLVVGSGNALTEYVKALSENPTKGIRFIGWIDSDNQAPELDIKELHFEDITFDNTGAPDAVIVGYTAVKHRKLDETLELLNKTFAQILIVPDVENVFIGYTIEDFHGLPMINVNSSRISMFQSLFKRLVDFLGSLIGLLLLLPFFFILGIIIKVSSNGPIFYAQERMTKDGKIFKMWKFRSMHTDAETTGAQWAEKNDDRRTPIGKVMRRTSIDEFPQLWNVFVGDMSLVGPRPERPVFIDKFKNEIPSYMLRHRMKSGITGWAQVNGWRGDTSLEKRIEFDLYYIRNWNLLLDIKILLLTVLKGFVNENAY